MKISYSKNNNVNRSFANLFKASVLAVGLVSAFVANALVLENRDNREINDIQVVGDRVYQFSGNNINTVLKFYAYDISKAGEYDTVLTPDHIASPNGGYNIWEKFSTNGEQFIFYDLNNKNIKTYLYDSGKFSNPIEIKLKDGSYPYIYNLEISGNYAMISEGTRIHILDISKSSSKEITDSQITIKRDDFYMNGTSFNGSNIAYADQNAKKVYIHNLKAGNEDAINSQYIEITPQDEFVSNYGYNNFTTSKYAVVTGTIQEGDIGEHAAWVYNLTSGNSNTISASEIRLKPMYYVDGNFDRSTISQNNYFMISSVNGPLIFNLDAGSEADINGSQLRLIYANNVDKPYSNNLSIDGDTFAFTDERLGNTKIIVGDVKSVTTLDDGSFQHISGFGFETLGNWVIGKDNSNNSILFNKLNAEGTIAQAIIQNEGRAVYIGQNAGSNNNTLRVLGKLVANDVYIGADGNTDNALIFGNEAVLNADNKFDIENIYLAENSMLIFECDWEHNSQKIFDYLNGADLWAWDAKTKSYVLIDESNYQDLLSITDYLDTNHMLVQVIPEPAITAAIIGALTLALAAYRRRK